MHATAEDRAYCDCETPVFDSDHDADCRRCGWPVDFTPLLDDAAKLIVRAQCADEHGVSVDVVSFVSERRYGRTYEDGRNIGEVTLRYLHAGLRSTLRDDLTPEDDEFWLIRPGHVCGALYGVYADGTFSLFMD